MRLLPARHRRQVAVEILLDFRLSTDRVLIKNDPESPNIEGDFRASLGDENGWLG